MAKVVLSTKQCSENPLKSSTPLGAALAYLGVQGAVPLFHGAQGCTAFALVLAVRHFKESVPLQTTAMNESTTIMGGAENLEEALINIAKRMKPELIGVASTALMETRGEDFIGELKTIVHKRRELDTVRVVFASTADFDGALEDGWARATTALIQALVPSAELEEPRSPVTLNVLPGVHETPGSLEELRETIESFGLEVRFLPDISTSLDGHVPDAYIGTSLGGISIREIERLGSAAHTIALGEHMRGPADALALKTGVPSTLLPSPIGLGPSDDLIALLARLSGRPVPSRLRRQRSQLIDAMLDAHFYLSGKRIAVASDPDLLGSLVNLLTSMGAEVVVAVSSTRGAGTVLDALPCREVLIGDLGDLETLAAEAGVELIVGPSHGRQAAKALGIPLVRVGFPIFDRLGHQHRRLGGYRGTRELVNELANTFLEREHEPSPSDFRRPGDETPKKTELRRA